MALPFINFRENAKSVVDYFLVATPFPTFLSRVFKIVPLFFLKYILYTNIIYIQNMYVCENSLFRLAKYVMKYIMMC